MMDFYSSTSAQSILCGPSLSIASMVPLLEQISEDTLWGFSLHLLCATRRGHYNSSIEKLLDRCPQAIIAYANHHLQDRHMVGQEQAKKTLVVVSMETNSSEFLELIPDDGTAAYLFLTCSPAARGTSPPEPCTTRILNTPAPSKTPAPEDPE
ncbi:hypothetical protein WMY93_024598 [Mugilogobius chulae]|uniref:BLOC-2 complex member HPS3 C-terminal domain-containing protein n=1 Tax=Mugilogobius chulae TaxID=88201 RepID=A0AAW0N1R1_9GOBI